MTVAGVVLLLARLQLGASADVPRVRFEALADGSAAAASTALEALRTRGILSVDGVPRLGAYASRGLSSVCDCLAADADAALTVLGDGVERRTVAWRAGSTSRAAELRADDAGGCGAGTTALRLAVDAATTLLFEALDRATVASGESSTTQVFMERRAVLDGEAPSSLFDAPDERDMYGSYAELFGRGSSLEHVHAYYPRHGTNEESSRSSLEAHTDAGLLLATVRASEEEAEGSEASRFEVDLGDGVLVPVKPDKDSVLLLVGDGGESWFADGAVPWHAAPHRLKVTNKRAWYGRMFFPPSDAIVRSSGLAFETHLSAAMAGTLEDDGHYDDPTKNLVGCGHGRSHMAVSSSTAAAASSSSGEDGGVDSVPEFLIVARRLSSVDPEFCRTSEGRDGIVCWLSCQSIQSLSCGGSENVACLDPTGEAVDGSQHCPGHGKCAPGCNPDSLEAAGGNGTSFSTNSGGFCFGDGQSMHMDGFRSVFEKHRPGCINLLFITWTLRNQGKFAGAIIGVIGLGVFTESLTFLRRRLHGRSGGSSYSRAGAMIFLHFIQACVAYALMLVAMTYSVELFFAACIGLTLGHTLFNIHTTPTNTDPCCNFMETSDGAAPSDLDPALKGEEQHGDLEKPACCRAVGDESKI